jgi:hypothetical protein
VVLLRGEQAVRLTRIQVKPSQVDDVIEVVGDEVVPSLSEAPGFRAALLFADPASPPKGRCGHDLLQPGERYTSHRQTW